jgi:hypothetical protein
MGSWYLADDKIGRLPAFLRRLSSGISILTPHVQRQRLTRDPKGTIVESLDKVWLLTIEGEKWRPVHGRRVAEIGPLAIVEYNACDFLEPSASSPRDRLI